MGASPLLYLFGPITGPAGCFLGEWFLARETFLLAVDKAAITSDVEETLEENLPGVEVVDVEVGGGPNSRGGNPALRVFIDHPEGVSHDLCVRVTGLLDRYLRDFTVEVSSPGLERRLRKPEHYLAAAGKKINVKTFGPVQGQRNFTGFLVSSNGQSLTLDQEGRQVRIPFSQVSRARTVFEFGKKSPRQSSKARKKKRRERGRAFE